MTTRPRGRAGWALLAVAGATALAACNRSEEATSSTHEPASVKEIKGSDVSQVRFTKSGAALVDLQTATAQSVAGHTVIPYAALIYDGQGMPWVYTAPHALTFLRVPVTVDRVDGTQVQVSGGLAPGARLVTVGATEVYGAELGIAGGH